MQFILSRAALALAVISWLLHNPVVSGLTPVSPVTVTTVECLEQPYDVLSGAFSLGKQPPTGPSMVFTLGPSPILYAIDIWGTTQTPVSLLTNDVAHMAAANARLCGVAQYRDSLYLVFARNTNLGLSVILQIDQPWSGSPVFRYHPVGSVRVYDVVAGSKALYLLTQPKTEDSVTNLMRFDLARGTMVGIQLPFSGGRIALTPDEGQLLAAGPSSNLTLCDTVPWRSCTLAFTLDPTNLRKVFSTASHYGGGCAVNALAAGSTNSIYLASSGGQFCDTQRLTGELSINGTWTFSQGEIDIYRTVTWAMGGYNFWDGFLEGIGGIVRNTANHQFTLQTDKPVRFDTPMVVTDASLGPCLVFPATTCHEGTLSLYVFSLKQFSG